MPNKGYFTHMFTFALAIGSTNLYAQEQQVQLDSSQLELKRFKNSITDRYTDDAFNYNVNDTGGVNLMQRILRKFFNLLEDIFGFDIGGIDYETLEFIIYGCLGLIVIYLIIKALINNKVSAVFKTESKHIEHFNFEEEELQNVDFDSLVKTAIKEENFRLATRFLYLKCLKLLAHSNTIDWHFEKTNSDYIKEIKDSSLKEQFSEASRVYEYIWYGEFPVDSTTFRSYKTNFQQLMSSIQNG